MAVNLTKGQRVSLTKDNDGLKAIMVGLGWDPLEEKQEKGFFSKLLSGPSATVDCDASVFMLENDKVTRAQDIIYFGNLAAANKSVIHQGDNLTGEGDGDDECIYIDLSTIESRINKLVFVVNIYEAQKKGQHFGMIQNAFIRLVDQRNGQEMLRYNLTDDFSGKLAVTVAEIYRHNNEWKFAAIGNGTGHPDLKSMVQEYS